MVRRRPYFVRKGGHEPQNVPRLSVTDTGQELLEILKPEAAMPVSEETAEGYHEVRFEAPDAATGIYVSLLRAATSNP